MKYIPPSLFRRTLTLTALTLLTACGGGGGGGGGGGSSATPTPPVDYQLEVRTEGNGFLLGTASRQIYLEGARLTVDETFEDALWPVPTPGYSFVGWGGICAGEEAFSCTLPTEQPAGSGFIEARFEPAYDGPLALIDYRYSWQPASRELIVLQADIVLQGEGEGATQRRVFMAPAAMNLVVRGRLEDGAYYFELPENDYGPDDYWMFVTAVDSEDTLASVSVDLGTSDFVHAELLQPAEQNGEWRDVLADCASADNPHIVCPVETLPYLGSVAPDPGVEEILHRTVVTHPWMGVRFRQVLENLPPELFKLFRGLTAVVIGSEIRPSFFSPLTGAIYLDPRDLWLSPEERDTIDWDPDHRAEFGMELDFLGLSDYLKGSDWAWYIGDYLPENYTRSISDIILPMAYLLVHELAHANDAMPPARLPELASALTPLDYYFRMESLTPSTTLDNTYPLNSLLLKRLGEVMYWNAEATADLRALTAAQVGLEFESDSANAMYSYSSSWEDTANLVEEVLLNYYFGLDKLVFFLDVPESENPECTEFTVRWSSINRASLPRIAERARLVLSEVLDEADVSSYLEAVPEQTALLPGISLCENLQIMQQRDHATPGIFRDVRRMQSRQHLHMRAGNRLRGRAMQGRARVDH